MNALLKFMSDNSYAGFFIANALTATILGGKNRDLQHKIAEENEAFQLRLEQQRNLSQEQMELEKIKFRRYLMELTREWQREERKQSFDNMARTTELHTFANQWKLNLRPSTILSLIKKANDTSPINVIFLHTPLVIGQNGQLTMRGQIANQMYKSIEDQIKKDVIIISDVKFHGKASKLETYTNADIMNIHYLMGSLPTIVFLPKYQDENIYLTVAMWDEISVRPLIRPLFSMPHDTILSSTDEKYRKEVIEKLHYTLSIITGTIRDKYAMLTWGKQPTLNALLDAKGNERIKQFALQNAGIRGFLMQENESTIQALDSAKTPALLNIYEQADINKMKALLVDQQKMLNAK